MPYWQDFPCSLGLHCISFAVFFPCFVSNCITHTHRFPKIYSQGRTRWEPILHFPCTRDVGVTFNHCSYSRRYVLLSWLSDEKMEFHGYCMPCLFTQVLKWHLQMQTQVNCIIKSLTTGSLQTLLSMLFGL